MANASAEKKVPRKSTTPTCPVCQRKKVREGDKWVCPYCARKEQEES